MKFYYFDSTHWDREWYKPFQYFRGLLLENTERILDTLEHQSAYRRFFFDGQTIVLEDITGIRPDLKERLSEQIRRGRLNVGPWYLMPDELLGSATFLTFSVILLSCPRSCADSASAPSSRGGDSKTTLPPTSAGLRRMAPSVI